MAWLILGLVLFLGVHSVRILAPDWRAHTIERVGEGAWKGVYSLLSIAGFVLIVWGYGQARAAGGMLVWMPPTGMRHVAALLTLLAFILLVAAYVPRNHIQRAVGHPMVIGVAIWALAHLLAVGWLHAIVLFGAFLAWAVADWLSARQRASVAPAESASAAMTGLTVVAGTIAWAAFAFWLHATLIGVAPIVPGI